MCSQDGNDLFCWLILVLYDKKQILLDPEIMFYILNKYIHVVQMFKSLITLSSI